MELSSSGEESGVEEASQTPAQQHQSRPARKGFQVPRKGTVPGKWDIADPHFRAGMRIVARGRVNPARGPLARGLD